MGLFRKLKRKVFRGISTFNEKRILAKKDKYMSFEFFKISDDVPVFLKDSKRKISVVYPYTPTILKHCFENLTPEPKLAEAEDIEYFKRKCGRAARICGGNPEKWKETIEELVSSLQQCDALDATSAKAAVIESQTDLDDDEGIEK